MIVTPAKSWDEHFDNKQPMVWLFTENDGGEFFAIICLPNNTGHCLLLEGNGTYMQPVSGLRAAGDPLDEGHGDSFGLVFYDDQNSAVIEADIPPLNQQFNVPDSDATWVRTSPDSYILELDERHDWMTVTPK